MRIIASRGWPGPDRPDSSAAAARAALAAGADGVQVDIRVTRDGVPVCMSNPLLRTTAAIADVSTMDHRTLRRVDPAATTVDDLLLAVRGRGSLLLVLHSDRRLAARPLRVAAAVAGRLAARGGPGDDVTVASFDPRLLGLFARELPGVRRALMSDAFQSATGCLERVSAFGADEMHAHVSSILAQPAVVEQAMDRGVAVTCWPVNRPVDARLLGVAGVNAVVTEHPRLLLAPVRVGSATASDG